MPADVSSAARPGWSRRRFLSSAGTVVTTGLIGVVGVCTTGIDAAGAQAVGSTSGQSARGTTTTLWKLNASWGHPVGPKGVTSCRCTACHRHAANKVFFSEAAAVAGRIHKCCVCQPESFTVPAATAAELILHSTSTASVDLRTPEVAKALGSEPTTTFSGSTTPTQPPTSTTDTARRSSLAFTGGSSVAPFGVVVVAAGAAITKLRSRRLATELDAADHPSDELGISEDVGVGEQERP